MDYPEIEEIPPVHGNGNGKMMINNWVCGGPLLDKPASPVTTGFHGLSTNL